MNPNNSRNIPISSYVMGNTIWTISEKRFVEQETFKPWQMSDDGIWTGGEVVKEIVWKETVSPPFIF